MNADRQGGQLIPINTAPLYVSESIPHEGRQTACQPGNQHVGRKLAYPRKHGRGYRKLSARSIFSHVGSALAIALLSAGVSAAHAEEGGQSANVSAAIVGQIPEYSPAVANEEAYWYSRYSLGSLSRMSGLGKAFSMTQMQSMLPSMIKAVGAASDDPIVIPKNPAVLYQVYAGGDPHFRTPLVDRTFLKDLGDARWVGGPPRLTTASTGFMVIKELEWAKMFHRDAHFGEANVDHFGAFWRLQGMIFAAEAKATLNNYLANRSRFKNSHVGDYALLTAFSDAADLYSANDLANSQGPNAGTPTYPSENRYLDLAAAAKFAKLAKAEFAHIMKTKPRSTRDLSLAIQSVVWFASIAKNPHDLGRSSAAVHRWANRLIHADADGPAERAYKVRGLIEAGRTTGVERYLRSAAATFGSMISGFDYVHGVLRGTEALSTDDVGEIAGAFNSAMIFLPRYINEVNTNALFGDWWEGTVDQSGFEISSPAVAAFKSPFELFDPPGRSAVLQNPLNYRYPSIPLPQNAGGRYGIAMVFASRIKWDAETQMWSANQGWFDTAGAMHAATELMWFHSDEVNGFPSVELN